MQRISNIEQGISNRRNEDNPSIFDIHLQYYGEVAPGSALRGCSCLINDWTPECNAQWHSGSAGIDRTFGGNLKECDQECRPAEDINEISSENN